MTRSLPLAGCLLALVLAGCGSDRPPATPAARPAPQADPLAQAIDYLNAGDQGRALKLVDALLRREPANPEANVLAASIRQDPVALLGPRNYPYRTVPGDTMLGLAERFLGNRLKFYELSRYNGLSVPAQLAPGTLLKIPGEPPRPAAAEAPPVAVAPRPVRRPKPVLATPAPVVPARPAIDPTRAAQLRAAALGLLNNGRAEQAAGLLRRAAALAPGNPAIARDLARAERVALLVRQRR